MSVKYIRINKLKIFTLNVNSIISHAKREQLSHFINNYNPDIILLCETKIKAKHKPVFTNYNFIRNDRLTNKGGGTGILIKSNIRYEPFNAPCTKDALEILKRWLDYEAHKFNARLVHSMNPTHSES